MNVNNYKRPLRYDKNVYFTDLKRLSIKIAEKFKEGNCEKAFNQIINCCNELEIYKKKDTNDYRIVRHRCNNRFCPICQNVRSGMYARFLSQQYEQSDPVKDLYYTVVFTCKNCCIDELRSVLKNISTAFSNWHQNFKHKLKDSAYFRSIEFTYNAKTNTFHPHIHVLLKYRCSDQQHRLEILDFLDTYNWSVDFAKYIDDNYVGYTHKDFLNTYGSSVTVCTNNIIDYYNTRCIDPSGFIKWVETYNEVYDPEKSSLFEFTKYITKMNDLLDVDPDVFVKCYYAAKNLNVGFPGGEWRKWKHMLVMENGEVWADRKSIRQNANYEFQCYFSSEEFVFCEDFGVSIYPRSKDLDLWLINHKIIRPDRFSNIITQGEGEYIRDG